MNREQRQNPAAGKNKALTFAKGIKDGLPICMGYFAVSFSFGILCVNLGLSPFIASLISLTNVTSAGQFAGVTLRGNVDSQSRWLLKIEDETMVRLYANEYNPVNAMYKFTFQGLRPGTTTVALKYAVSWDAPAIADKALNITVLPDFTLRIVETER